MSIPIHSRRGQTIVEALVALSILTAGFIGIVSLLTKSFQLNRVTTNDTQATYLASEGIEIAKNIIDYDVYYGFGLTQSSSTVDYWGCSFGLGENQTADFALEYDTTPIPCADSNAVLPTISQSTTDHLYFNPSSTLYTYSNFAPGSTAIPTDFTRDVYVSVPNGSPNEIDVRSKVTWSDGLLSNTITLEDHFYNWHPQP